jgi:hypothetical protein
MLCMWVLRRIYVYAGWSFGLYTDDEWLVGRSMLIAFVLEAPHVDWFHPEAH